MMLNKTFLLMILSLLFVSCAAEPTDGLITPAVNLEPTVSALETSVADLQNAMKQTATNVATVVPLAATLPPSEPTATPQSSTSQQVTPYTGPVNIIALAYASSRDALYLVRMIDIQRNQDGIEQTLYTWPEAIPDLLANFSADGSVLAARLNNGNLVIVGLPQGELLQTLRFQVDFMEWPISLVLSADGTQLAVALGENTVQVWDVKTGKLIFTLTQPGEGVAYQKLTYSPNGANLLAGFLNTITHWDIATGELTTFEPGCWGDTIFDLSYSPDGKQLAIACGPVDNPVGSLILWDVMNNRPIFQKDEILQMQRVAFSPDGKWLATGGHDGTVMLWNTTENKEPISIQSQFTPIADLILSPDGSELVYSAEGGLWFEELKDIVPH